MTQFTSNSEKPVLPKSWYTEMEIPCGDYNHHQLLVTTVSSELDFRVSTNESTDCQHC